MAKISPADQELATRRKLRFRVATKDGKRQPWVFDGETSLQLRAAYTRAQALEAREVAIIIVDHSGDEFVYWSSADPKRFDSVLLRTIMV